MHMLLIFTESSQWPWLKVYMMLFFVLLFFKPTCPISRCILWLKLKLPTFLVYAFFSHLFLITIICDVLNKISENSEIFILFFKIEIILRIIYCYKKFNLNCAGLVNNVKHRVVTGSLVLRVVACKSWAWTNRIVHLPLQTNLIGCMLGVQRHH